MLPLLLLLLPAELNDRAVVVVVTPLPLLLLMIELNESSCGLVRRILLHNNNPAEDDLVVSLEVACNMMIWIVESRILV